MTLFAYEPKSLLITLVSCLLLATAAGGQEYEPSACSTCESCLEDGSGDCSDCNCRAGGCRGGACTTVRDMWQREYQAGDEPQHYSYDTRRIYYYRRPYNARHVRQNRSIGHAYHTGAAADASSRFSYRDRSEVFQRLESEIADRLARPVEGGYLEFVDWQRHQEAKSEWDAQQLMAEESAKDTPVRQSRQRSNERTPLR